MARPTDKLHSLWPLAILGLLVALWPSKRNQSSESIHPKDSADNEDNKVKAKTVLAANAVPRIPDTNSTNGRKYRTPPWEKLAVLIALGLLIVNICQTRATKKAAKATQSAAETAAKQLEMAERPWISANIRLASDLTFDADGGHIEVRTILTNSGHSPAQTWMNSTLIVGPNGKNILDEAKQFAEQTQATERTNPWIAESVFPGVESVPRIDTNSVKRSDIENAVQFMRKQYPGVAFLPRIDITLVVCIAYTPTFTKADYRTTYIYKIAQAVPAKPNISVGIDPSERVVPLSSLVFTREYPAGVYAH